MLLFAVHISKHVEKAVPSIVAQEQCTRTNKKDCSFTTREYIEPSVRYCLKALSRMGLVSSFMNKSILLEKKKQEYLYR